MNPEARRLDRAILGFIRRFRDADQAPENDFTELALRIFSYQFQGNEAYRRFCGIEGVSPKTARSWKEIPAMPAEGFKRLTLTAFPQKKARRVFRTSGTTQGARGSHYFDTTALYEASISPAFKKYLLPDRAHMELYFLTAPPSELKDSSLSFMMGFVRNRFGTAGSGKFYVKKKAVLSERLAYDLLRAKRPAMLLSTAFSLKVFLDYLSEKNISLHLPPGSRLMETGGFKGRAHEVSKTVLYRECRKRLGLAPWFCVSEYGMTELSSQYYDTTLSDHLKKKKRTPFKAGPAWMRPLVVSLATGKEARAGETGILRHCDLANRGSVIAIQTEDLGRARGAGFEFCGRAQGAQVRGCSLTYEEFLKSK